MGAVNQVEHKVADHGGNRGSASPPESHRALMGFHSYTRAGLCPAIHCLDSRCSLMQQRPVSRLNSIDQFFRTYCRSGGITKASRSVCLCVCVCVCVCVSWQSHRDGVVRAKTQVAISRSGADAVSVSVRATGGRRGAGGSVKFGICPLPDFRFGWGIGTWSAKGWWVC